MPSAAIEVTSRVKMSDPKPHCCSACYRGADENTRFVDFDAAFDAGALISNESQSILESFDDLHLCESCVREAAQTLGFKPDLHRKQFREIKRLEIENDHWRDYAKSLERNLAARPEPELRAA
jgi:hypothetical protein